PALFNIRLLPGCTLFPYTTLFRSGAATTGALVLVGVFMMESITQIDMKNIAEALPAFITIITMVLTYSVANGIILGMLCYVLLRSEEHTSELQSRFDLVCRLLLEK